MQKFILSFFLFLLLTVNTSGETFTLEAQYSADCEYSFTGSGGGQKPIALQFADISYYTHGIYLITRFDKSAWKGGAAQSDYEYVTLTDGADSSVIGNGILGYWNNSGTYTFYIYCAYDNWDSAGKSGTTVVYLSYPDGDDYKISVNSSQYTPINHAGPLTVTMASANSGTIGHTYAAYHAVGDYDIQALNYFRNDVDYYYHDTSGMYHFDVDKNVNGMPGNSAWNITSNSYAYDEGINHVNFSAADINGGWWNYRCTLPSGKEFTGSVVFGEGSTAEIDFNQTFYTDPESVGVEYDITDINLENYEYWIEIIGRNDDSVGLGVNAEYKELTDSSGQSNYTIERQWLTLPMTIQGILYAYDKNTGIISELAATTEAQYNPESMAPGAVWTDKDSYNTTEIVTIFTDTVNGGKLKVDKRDDPLYDWYSIYSGLSNIKLATQTSYVGAWDVYLYEEDTSGNYVITNQTNFTVLADEDTAYFNWWRSHIYQGEPASYDYIATSTNSIIKIYDGENTELYRFNASTGYNTGQISTTSGTVGNWTGSLYDNGTYYNASLEVESSYSWVRFQDDSYYVGDTIIIEYFIVNPDHKIRLRDGLCSHGGRTTVLTWMPGTFMTGQRGTLEYSLTEDNEFGHDVETQFNSGYLTPGDWKVQASGTTSWNETENAEDTTYVHGTDKGDQIGGTGGEGSIIAELQSIAELAGFRGEVGLFILSIFIIIMASVSMLIGHFPVQGVLCIDILLFFAFIGIGFIPILYLILFGVVAGLIVFGTIFFRKAG